MSITALAQQGPSLVGAMSFDPYSSTLQTSGGMAGSATVPNPQAFDLSHIHSQLLFVESNNSLDQGTSDTLLHLLREKLDLKAHHY